MNHVVPRLGARRVADIVALHHALRATPYQANRTVQILSRLFTLSEVWGLRPTVLRRSEFDPPGSGEINELPRWLDSDRHMELRHDPAFLIDRI